jgi:hypothetical protein
MNVLGLISQLIIIETLRLTVSKHNLSLQMPQSDLISICGWHQKWRIGVSPVVEEIEVAGWFFSTVQIILG